MKPSIKRGGGGMPRMFDNYDVKYVHRRLTAAGLNMLEHLRELTYAHAQAQGQEDLWPMVWKHTLPSIAYYNKYIQRSVANEVIAQIPDIEKSVQTTFQLYCKLYFGRDVHGNVNIIKGTVPPFSEFYHCFLTRLCADPAVVRLQVFDNHDLLEKAVKNAILDGLRDTSVDRVQILETLTEAQFKARAAATAPAPPPVKKITAPAEEDEEDWVDGSRCSRTTTGTAATEATEATETTEATAAVVEDVETSREKAKGKEEASNQFMIHGGVVPPLPPHVVTPVLDSKSAVSVHGAEWLKRLETAAVPMKKYPALGPDDSASSVNSLGIQHQQRQKMTAFREQDEELSSLLPTTRRVNMTAGIDSASMPPSQIKQTHKHAFSDKASSLF